VPEDLSTSRRNAWRPRSRALALGLAHAALFAVSFPPLGWWWAAFVAPVPLLVLAARPGGSALGAGFWAAVGVAPFWVWSHAWIGAISAAGVYPLVVYLSLYAWAFVVLGHLASRTRAVPPALGLAVAWVGLEFFRARIAWSGYPWYLSGHPLIASPGLAWPAMVSGVSLVSLLVVLPGAWLTTRTANPRWCGPVIGLLCIAWIGVGIAWRGSAPRPPAEPVRIGIVQTNVPQDNRMDWTLPQRLLDWEDMRDLTITAAAAEPTPDLIVWPEGLVPGWTFDPVSLATESARGIVWQLRPRSDAEAAVLARYGRAVPATLIADELRELQRSLGVPMLVGAVAYERLEIRTGDTGAVEYDSEAMFNSAFLVRNGRVADVWYDKVHLTPFGEIMPYISAWPWLEDRLLAIGARGMSFGLTPARSVRTIPLDLPGGRSVELATPICFEATMPALCRRLVRRAASTGRPVVMVNITNDGWFGRSDRGRVMHELSARWRCVELGVPMVRCANTGVSGLIDARGGVVERAPARVAAALPVEVIPARPGTIFARVGEPVGWLSLAGIAVLAWLGRASRNRDSREPSRAAERTG
jgi:apolipoprotein N-acyltransferase